MDAVVVTGLGVVAHLGLSASELTARFAAGESALGPLPDTDGAGAAVRDIPRGMVPMEAHARLGRLDRVCRLFLSAAYSAVGAAGITRGTAAADRVGLSFGTGWGCLLTNAEYFRKIAADGTAAASPRLFAYTVSSAAAGEVSIALGIRGANVTAHAGLAAGLQALGPVLVRALADMGLLKRRAGAVPLRDVVPGVYPSEGAAVAVLERRPAAQ